MLEELIYTSLWNRDLLTSAFNHNITIYEFHPQHNHKKDKYVQVVCRHKRNQYYVLCTDCGRKCTILYHLLLINQTKYQAKVATIQCRSLACNKLHIFSSPMLMQTSKAFICFTRSSKYRLYNKGDKIHPCLKSPDTQTIQHRNSLL